MDIRSFLAEKKPEKSDKSEQLKEEYSPTSPPAPPTPCQSPIKFLNNSKKTEHEKKQVKIDTFIKYKNYVNDPSEINNIKEYKSKMNFTETQQTAFDAYLKGENIFITGSGGCGKSYFIKSLYEHAINNKKNIKVASLTGCSAILLNCNATTIHKWGSLGLAKGEEFDIYTKIIKMKRKDNYLNTEILVIDEVSMLNQKMFELLDYLCKKIRKNNELFGGIQLILSGDFYQLPPVCTDKSNLLESSFCFESPLWAETFKHSFIFDINFRQNNDPEFFEILQKIRQGKIDFETTEKLIYCSQKKINNDDPVKPTKIFPIKKKVDQINQEELSKLKDKMYNYSPQIYYNNTEVQVKQITPTSMKTEIEYVLKNSMFEEELKLCIGSQVMCISNIDQENNLVNGSQGIIIGFEYDVENNENYPIIKFDKIDQPKVIKRNSWKIESDNKYTISQIPIILSWAITIHKSQGLSIEKALIDIGNNIFEYGQTYVALSRVKSLNGLYLTKVNARKIKAHPKVIQFYNSLNQASISNNIS